MEDLIKSLTVKLIARLDDIEKESNFPYLFSLEDEEIRNEALLLLEEMNNLKSRLKRL